MKMIYESAIADMTVALESTIKNFSKAYDANTMRPLFCVSNYQFLLMKNVEKYSNVQVLNGCRKLCIDICKQMELKIVEIPGNMDIDFVLETESGKQGFLISMTDNFTPNISDEIMSSLNELVVVVLQEEIDGVPVFCHPNSHKYRDYKYKELIRQITIKQFFEMLGRDDYEDFRECVGKYNYEAEQMLGMTVSAIPTKKAVDKHKCEIRKRLLDYFYKDELRTVFNEKEITDMKMWFEKNCEILISNADFAKSFISSEWHYDLQIMTDGGIDQTAIVAGYLKSLEQLLLSIVLVLSDDKNDEVIICPKSRKKKSPLTSENQIPAYTTAGKILGWIDGNQKYVMRKTEMTDRVLEYLKQYVRKTRNSYMHKDNLYEWTDIQNIRTKTYAAYFMIIGTFYINAEKLSHIND